MNFHRDVGDVAFVRQELSVVKRITRLMRDHRDDGGEVLRPDAPDVQVRDPVVCVRLDQDAEPLPSRFTDLGVKENAARVVQ